VDAVAGDDGDWLCNGQHPVQATEISPTSPTMNQFSLISLDIDQY
jgi:hypothetical protein